jgi:hypothetical protein
VPGVAQDPPRHRDLRDVEIPVRQRHQNAHPGIISRTSRCEAPQIVIHEAVGEQSGPVMVSHGLGAPSKIFTIDTIDTIETTLAEYLFAGVRRSAAGLPGQHRPARAGDAAQRRPRRAARLPGRPSPSSATAPVRFGPGHGALECVSRHQPASLSPQALARNGDAWAHDPR